MYLCADMAHRIHAPVLILAALTPLASAGMINRSVFRQPIVTIDDHSRYYAHPASNQPAYDTFDLSLTHTNDTGSSTSKASFESFSSENLLKISADCSIHTQQGTPGEYLLGRLSSYFRFNLLEETTFDLRHTTTDRSMGDFVLFDVDIFEYTAGQNRVFDFETQEQSAGTQRITLGPGEHRIYVRTWLIRDLANNPGFVGHTAFNSTFEFRVVPAPTTLATLIPLGIAATRRKR